MSAPVGHRLRDLRAARRLSLAALSRLAQVPKSTLSAWETGLHTPAGPDLAGLLTHLGADARQRACLLAEADPAHAAQALSRSRLGPPLGTGEILRAMRVRRGFTQGKVAATLGATQSTVARWETAEALPKEATLALLLDALGASSAEGALLRGTEPVEGSPDLRTRLAAAVELPTRSLRQAALLLLEREAWRRAARDPKEEGLLAETIARRARDLGPRAANALGERALRLAGRAHPVEAGAALVCLLMKTSDLWDPRALAALVEEWEPAIPDLGTRAQIRCELAAFLARHEGARARDLARSMADLAYGATLPIQSVSRTIGDACALWPIMLVQLQQEDWEGALETFEKMDSADDPDSPLDDYNSSLCLAEAYFGLRERPPSALLGRLRSDLEEKASDPKYGRIAAWLRSFE